MRIGTDAFFRSVSRTLCRLQKQLGDQTVMMSTGKRVRRPSDDPLSSIAIARAHTELRASEARARILDGAQWVSQAADVYLGQISDALGQALLTSLQALEPGYQTEGMREVFATEVRSARDAVLSAANARCGDRYLFAGYQDRKVPFLEGPGGVVDYVGDGKQLVVPIGEGRTCPISVPGDLLMNMGGTHVPGASRDVFTVLSDLARAIQTGDHATVRQRREELMVLHEHVVQLRGYVGASQMRLRANREALDDTQMRCTEILNQEESVDLAEVISQYATQETVYKSVLHVYSRILSLPTVFDLAR